MAVTCYKNYGTPLNCTGVPVTCTGKSQALENTTRCCVLLPLSRGADFSWLCFGTPDFPTANSQMRMALFHWWLPKNAAGWALEAQECCSPGSETSIISQRPLRGTSGPGEKQCHDTSHGTEHGSFSGCFHPTCNYFAALSIS